MGHSTEYDHLTGETDAARITDHPFDPSDSELDAYCLTCQKRGWTTLRDDHAGSVCGNFLSDGELCKEFANGADGACSDCRDRGENEDSLCPSCGLDNDPNFGGCSCYGDPDDRARFIIAERSRLLSLSGLPLVEDALAFARSLR